MKPFTVQTQPGGRSFAAPPHEPLLSAALRQGIGLPYGCRGGTCGSCAARLVAGRVSYPAGRPEALRGLDEATTCLTCQAVAESDLVIEVREVPRVADLEVRTLPCRLVRKEALNHDVLRLLLKLPETQRLQFLAGQYIEFLLRDGRRRAFSLANPPHDDELLELHVRVVPGGHFTDTLLTQLAERAILRLRGPLGTFVLDDSAERPLLLVGGGTGFAPLKAMIEHAIQRGDTRSCHLYWGARTRADLYLPQLPETWRARWPGFRFTPVLSQPDADWPGRRGWVHEAVMADYPDLSPFDLYLSGPPAMIEAARAGFGAQGAEPTRFHSDAFAYAGDAPT